MTKGKILIVDDEKDIRFLLREILEDEGYAVGEAPHSEAAFAEFAKMQPDLVILDIWLENSDRDGMEILADLKKKTRTLPVLMISGHGNIEMAVKAIKLGAYDFIEKPFNTDRLLHLVTRALESGRLRRASSTSAVTIAAGSPEMQTVLKAAQKAAQGEARLLITGPWGSGRSHLARFIHQESARAAKPFVSLWCNDLDIHEAFTAADEGTLVLRDIQTLSSQAQNELLARLNAKPNVRVIATTDRDLGMEPSFSSDLLGRLSVMNIALPALDDRRGDIAELAHTFIQECFAACGMASEPRLSDAVLANLRRSGWPGQIAELRTLCQMAAMRMFLDKAEEALEKHFTFETAPALSLGGTPLKDWMGTDLRSAREAFERWYFENLMEKFNGNVAQVAEFAGMDRTALHRKLKALKDGDEAERLAS